MKNKQQITVRRVIPVLTEEERGRNIENFVNTLATVFKVNNYDGCHYDGNNQVTVFYKY